MFHVYTVWPVLLYWQCFINKETIKFYYHVNGNKNWTIWILTVCNFADIASIVVAVAVHKFSIWVGCDHETIVVIIVRFTRVIDTIGRRASIQPIGRPTVYRRRLLVKSNVVFIIVVVVARPVRHVIRSHTLRRCRVCSNKYRMAQKVSYNTNFCPYLRQILTDFHFFFHWHILCKICNKVITKYTITP